MSIINMKNIQPDQYPKRRTKTVEVHVGELPERTVNVLKTNQDRHKLITECESVIRKSMEYRDYIQLLKMDYNMRFCAILPAITKSSGKKYTIELHHDPFTLYDIVDLEIIRREVEHEPLDVLSIAETVMGLHYDGLVGLIPLSKTQHELVDCHKVFIPLQHIFFDYAALYEHYQPYIETKAEHIKKKIDLKYRLSIECGDLQSEAASPEFVYLDIDGVQLPEINEEWLNCLSRDRKAMAEEEKKKEREEKKKKAKNPDSDSAA